MEKGEIIHRRGTPSSAASSPSPPPSAIARVWIGHLRDEVLDSRRLWVFEL